MIFCVGHTASYALAVAAGVDKLGRRGPDEPNPEWRNYPGGGVWRAAADATAYLVANGLADTYSVYGVDADWDCDTEQLPGEPYRHLLRDAKIVPAQLAPPAGLEPATIRLEGERSSR